MKTLRATLDTLSLRELKASLRTRYAASAHKDLLATINTSLVLCDDLLINTSNGEYRQLAAEEGKSLPDQIAQSAAQLLAGRGESASILLLLPPADFVATHFAMGISGEKLLRSALKLQAHTLIPAYEENLLLGVNGSTSEGIAFWCPARHAEALFIAFQQQGLFLAALMPRTLALLETSPGGDQILIDEDSRHIAWLECRNGVVRGHLGISQLDLRQEEFAAQWELETAKLAPAIKVQSTGKEFWLGLRQLIHGQESYSFFPAGAEQHGRNLVVRRQKRILDRAGLILFVLLFLPFLNNWIQIAILEGRVESLREESAVPRQSQATVYALEDEWGAISEYPRQDVAQVLLTLNEMIENSLSTFAIDKGVVDITGFAQDPALLVEQLAEREEFYNVSQSRSSSGGNESGLGDRFGIRFNLSEVDFPAYEAEHPVTQSQE